MPADFVKTGAGREKAGTLPIELVCQFEIIAMAVRPDLPAADSVLVFYARSILAFGILGSLRVQDLEEITEIKIDHFAPDTVISALVRLSKNGEPLEVFAPAEGILGPFAWWPQHRDLCRRHGNPFPAFVKPHGSRGRLALSPGFKDFGNAGGDDIRDAIKEIAAAKRRPAREDLDSCLKQDCELLRSASHSLAVPAFLRNRILNFV